MRYVKTITTDRPEDVIAQPGQWIDYMGARGRLMGRIGVSVWIAWGKTATHRFPLFASSYNTCK